MTSQPITLSKSFVSSLKYKFYGRVAVLNLNLESHHQVVVLNLKQESYYRVAIITLNVEFHRQIAVLNLKQSSSRFNKFAIICPRGFFGTRTLLVCCADR